MTSYICAPHELHWFTTSCVDIDVQRVLLVGRVLMAGRVLLAETDLLSS